MVCDEAMKVHDPEDSDESSDVQVNLSDYEKSEGVSDQNIEEKVDSLLSKPVRGSNRRNKEKKPVIFDTEVSQISFLI